MARKSTCRLQLLEALVNERDARAIAQEFRRAAKRFDDLERRMASVILGGNIAKIDGDRVRIELEPANPKTGKPFLSPWVQMQEAAGQTGTHFPVKVGDPVRLLSPNGDLGPASLAVRDGYTSDAANPTDQKQAELVIAHDGPVRIKGSAIVFDADGAVDVNSASLKHNDVNVGDDHGHVSAPPGIPGPPVSS